MMALGKPCDMPLKCPWCNAVIIPAGERIPNPGHWQKCPDCDQKIELTQCAYTDHPAGVVFRIIPSASAPTGQGLGRDSYFPPVVSVMNNAEDARRMCDVIHRRAR